MNQTGIYFTIGAGTKNCNNSKFSRHTYSILLHHVTPDNLVFELSKKVLEGH